MAYITDGSVATTVQRDFGSWAPVVLRGLEAAFRERLASADLAVRSAAQRGIADVGPKLHS